MTYNRQTSVASMVAKIVSGLDAAYDAVMADLAAKATVIGDGPKQRLAIVGYNAILATPKTVIVEAARDQIEQDILGAAVRLPTCPVVGSLDDVLTTLSQPRHLSAAEASRLAAKTTADGAIRASMLRLSRPAVKQAAEAAAARLRVNVIDTLAMIDIDDINRQLDGMDHLHPLYNGGAGAITVTINDHEITLKVDEDGVYGVQSIDGADSVKTGAGVSVGWVSQLASAVNQHIRRAHDARSAQRAAQLDTFVPAKARIIRGGDMEIESSDGRVMLACNDIGEWLAYDIDGRSIPNGADQRCATILAAAIDLLE